jgi:hypothetical protein
MNFRKLREAAGRSNALMKVYECDSCLWGANLFYEKKVVEVELKFDGHDCNEKPFRTKRIEL